jgi:hypothetical protein
VSALRAPEGSVWIYQPRNDRAQTSPGFGPLDVERVFMLLGNVEDNVSRTFLDLETGRLGYFLIHSRVDLYSTRFP